MEISSLYDILNDIIEKDGLDFITDNLPGSNNRNTRYYMVILDYNIIIKDSIDQMEKDYIHNEKSYFESLKNIKSNGILKNMNIEYSTNMYRKLYVYNFLKKYINENIDNSIKLTEIEL